MERGLRAEVSARPGQEPRHHVDHMAEQRTLFGFSRGADFEIAKQSLRDQIYRLRSHASVVMWLNGSDNPPPPDVEQMYLGIEKELLGRVFDLFTQGKRSLDRAQGGLGLGLTLVRSLVELHGGRVSVASDGTLPRETSSIRPRKASTGRSRMVSAGIRAPWVRSSWRRVWTP